MKFLTSIDLSQFQSTPSARRATVVSPKATVDITFQSTPSARRATDFLGVCASGKMISIHALREEGDTVSLSRRTYFLISIHALREEGD